MDNHNKILFLILLLISSNCYAQDYTYSPLSFSTPPSTQLIYPWKVIIKEPTAFTYQRPTQGIATLSIAGFGDNTYLKLDGSNANQNINIGVYGFTAGGVIDFGGATSFEVPNGAGGTTVDTTGEVCIDTTSKTLNINDGASETVLNPIQSKSITIENPTASEDISLFYTDDAITVTKIVFVITGSTSVTTTIRHGTDRSAAGAEVVTGGTVANSTTTGNVVTSFDDATIVADSFVWLETTALSSTPTSLSVTLFFKQDP